jgi:hypothetical protein
MHFPVGTEGALEGGCEGGIEGGLKQVPRDPKNIHELASEKRIIFGNSAGIQAGMHAVCMRGFDDLFLNVACTNSSYVLREFKTTGYNRG